MKKSILLSITLLSLFFFSNAQTTVMQLSGADCYGNNHDLFADLDAGKDDLVEQRIEKYSRMGSYEVLPIEK